MNMHKVLPIPILFRCKTCKCFFENVENFYYHKKSCVSFSEFQKINCFIFEETNIEDDIIENGFRLASNYDSPAPIAIQNLTTSNPDDVSGSGSGSGTGSSLNVKTDVKLSSSALPMDTTEADDCLQVIEYEYHEDSLVIKDESETLNSRNFEQQFDLADPVPGPSIDLIGIQSVKSVTSKNHISNPVTTNASDADPDPDIPPNPDGSDVIIQSEIIISSNSTKAEAETETEEAVIQYKCSQCSKICTTESQLQLHLRICERYKTKSYNCNTRNSNSSDSSNGKCTPNSQNQQKKNKSNNAKKSRTLSPSSALSKNTKVTTPTPTPPPTPAPTPAPTPPPNSISNSIKIQVQKNAYEVKADFLKTEAEDQDEEEDDDDEGDTEPSKFVCQLCGCTFPYKHSLDNHLKTHSESLPFKCPRCKFTFHSQRHLTQHIAARHSDLRPVPLRSPFRSS